MDLENLKPEDFIENTPEVIKQIINDKNDPETQAQLLGEMIKIISEENKVEISEIMTNLSQEPGDINMAKLIEKIQSKK